MMPSPPYAPRRAATPSFRRRKPDATSPSSSLLSVVAEYDLEVPAVPDALLPTSQINVDEGRVRPATSHHRIRPSRQNQRNPQSNDHVPPGDDLRSFGSTKRTSSNAVTNSAPVPRLHLSNVDKPHGRQQLQPLSARSFSLSTGAARSGSISNTPTSAATSARKSFLLKPSSGKSDPPISKTRPQSANSEFFEFSDVAFADGSERLPKDTLFPEDDPFPMPQEIAAAQAVIKSHASHSSSSHRPSLSQSASHSSHGSSSGHPRGPPPAIVADMSAVADEGQPEDELARQLQTMFSRQQQEKTLLAGMKQSSNFENSRHEAEARRREEIRRLPDWSKPPNIRRVDLAFAAGLSATPKETHVPVPVPEPEPVEHIVEDIPRPQTQQTMRVRTDLVVTSQRVPGPQTTRSPQKPAAKKPTTRQRVSNWK